MQNRIGPVRTGLKPRPVRRYATRSQDRRVRTLPDGEQIAHTGGLSSRDHERAIGLECGVIQVTVGVNV